MSHLLSALVMSHAGVGIIEYGIFAAITALMVMFVVETVSRYS